jgi:CDP-diacylglycerol--glycerol-3-phosphate 3-phosphatidyltransferase
MIDGRRGRNKPDGEPSSTLRQQVAKIDLGQRLVKLGLNANVLTSFGVLLSAGFCVAVGNGQLWLGIALLIVGGLMDALDGLVAKSSGTASARGAFFDSVADRFSDAFMFGGLAWFLLTGPHPKEAALPFAIMAIGSSISYERAKAESLGFIAKGGLMERTERLIALGLSLLFHVVMIPILWVTLVLTLGTAIGRFIRVWRQASGLPARIWIWKESAPSQSDSTLKIWWQNLAIDRRVAIRVDQEDEEPVSSKFRQMFSLDRSEARSTLPGSRRAGHERKTRTRDRVRARDNYVKKG